MKKERSESERKIPSVLDNPPSEETQRAMAEFFYRTSYPRIMKAYEEGTLDVDSILERRQKLEKNPVKQRTDY